LEGDGYLKKSGKKKEWIKSDEHAAVHQCAQPVAITKENEMLFL
jgi:hypothetical protein